MAVAGLEINDAGVILGFAGRLLVESPGYALEDDTGVWVGESARARARLAPRLVNHGFWERLDAEPATRPVGHARTHADLVARHFLLPLRTDNGRHTDFRSCLFDHLVIRHQGPIEHRNIGTDKRRRLTFDGSRGGDQFVNRQTKVVGA